MQTKPEKAEIRFLLDPEAIQALDSACHDERSSRTGYLRMVLLRALRDAGYLQTFKPATQEAAR